MQKREAAPHLELRLLKVRSLNETVFGENATALSFKEIQRRDPYFSLPDFVAEVQEMVRPALTSHLKGDVETLKKYCSAEVIERCKGERTAYESQGMFFDSKAVEVANEVNSWVENVSAGLIKELLPSGSVDSNTRLVFGNALYFNGAWERKFDASETKDSEFFLLDGSSVQVQFMTTKEKQYVSSYDDFSVLKLPYKQGEDKRQFSMYVFLPDAKDGLWKS